MSLGALTPMRTDLPLTLRTITATWSPIVTFSPTLLVDRTGEFAQDRRIRHCSGAERHWQFILDPLFKLRGRGSIASLAKEVIIGST